MQSRQLTWINDMIESCFKSKYPLLYDSLRGRLPTLFNYLPTHIQVAIAGPLYGLSDEEGIASMEKYLTRKQIAEKALISKLSNVADGDFVTLNKEEVELLREKLRD